MKRRSEVEEEMNDYVILGFVLLIFGWNALRKPRPYFP